MKRVLVATTLVVSMAATVMADGFADLLPALLGGTDENKERQKRYERRYEIMMVRDSKQGKISPLRPVESPVAPEAQVVPVMPVMPVSHGAAYDGNAPVLEKVSIRAIALVYDVESGNGTLKVEVAGGSFSDVNSYIHDNIGKLVRNEAPGEDAPKVPPDALLEIEAITLVEDCMCEVKFTAKSTAAP